MEAHRLPPPVLPQRETAFIPPLSPEYFAELSIEARTRTKKRAVHQVSRPPHEPLRIHIATEALYGDEFSCYAVGDVVQALQSSVPVSYTCTESDVLTEEKRDYLVNTLLASGVDWVLETLSVHRSQDGRTDLSSLESCGTPPLVVQVPTAIKDGGGVDADFVLFVTARPILSTSTLAFASTCALNGINRPIAGHANFNPLNLDSNPLDFPRQAGVAVHELSHALGFSSSRWNSDTFVEYLPGGSEEDGWAVRLVPKEEVVSEVIVASGYSFGRIISPTVAEAVRSHYDCDDLVGADLEDSGGAGTAGSHWEKRLFANEFMTGTESNYPVRSAITLALFQDTGWYEVNMTNAEQFIWGRHQGCAMAQGDCGNWEQLTTMKGICSKPNDPALSCTFDRRAYGTCNVINSHSSLPVHFRHYGDAHTGGQSSLYDYCGFVAQQGAATYCNTGSSSATSLADTLDFANLNVHGDSFGLQSRCMLSTLNRVNAAFEVESFADITIPAPQSPRCYPAICVAEDDLRLSVERTWFKCPSAGGSIKVIGFGGVLHCPPALEICSDTVADSSWPVVESVTPTYGPPSTRITITGRFNPSLEYEVEMEVLSSQVRVLDEFTIEATIPGRDHFVSIADLAIFQTKKHVIVREVVRGYSSHITSAFIIEVAFDGRYLENLAMWMGRNPGWAFLLIVLFVSPSCCLALCCYCALKKKKRKPSQAKFGSEVEVGDYYEDQYDVDDYYGADCETQTTLTNDEAPERPQTPAPSAYPPSLLRTLPPPTPRMVEAAREATHFFAPPFHPPPHPHPALREVAVSGSSSSASSSLSFSFPPASVGPASRSPSLPLPPPSLSFPSDSSSSPESSSSSSSSSFSSLGGDSEPPSTDSEDESPNPNSLVSYPPPTPALLLPRGDEDSSSSGPPTDTGESLSSLSSGSSSYLTLSSFDEDL